MCSLLLTTSLVLVLGNFAQAADGTWTSASNGAWGTNANWASNTIAGASSGTGDTSTATFNTSTGVAVTVDATRNLQNITFSGASVGSFTLGSGGLFLTSGGTIQLASGAGSTTAGQTETINTPITLAAGATSGGSYTFANNTTSTDVLNFGSAATITSAATSGATNLTLSGNNTGANAISGVISNGGGLNKVQLIKNGAGTWILNGAAVNTYTGATQVNQGTLVLDFSNLSGATNLVSSSSGLLLDGGTLSIKGQNGVTTSQTFNGVTIGTYDSAAITLTQNGATALNLSLGAISRGNTGNQNILDITLPTTGTVTTTSSAMNDILVATLNSVAFATANGGATWLANTAGAGTLSAYNGYATGNASYNTSTNNIDVTNGDAPVSGVTVNTLRFNSATDGLTLAGTNTINAGGILVTPTATNASITGGTLRPNSTYKELVVIDYGAINIGSAITPNGTNTLLLTLGGPGVTTLSGAITTNTTGSTLEALPGATVKLTGSLALTGGVGNTTTIGVGTGGTFSEGDTGTGVISGSGSLTLGAQFAQNQGTFNLNGLNTFTGVLTLWPVNSSGGIITINTLANGSAGANSLGESSNAASNLVFAGSGTVLAYIGSGGSTDRLFTFSSVTSSSNEIDSSGSGAINFTNSGSIIFVSTDVLTLGGINTGTNTFTPIVSGSNAIKKQGAGTWELNSAQTYTGATTVSNGTLILTSGSLGGTAVTVGSGATPVAGVSGNATLQINGNYTIGSSTAGTLNIKGGNAGGTPIGQGTLSLTGATSSSNVTLTLANTSATNVFTIGSATTSNPAILNMEVGSSSDKIVVNGSGKVLILSGATAGTTKNMVNITGVGGLTGTTQTLISGTLSASAGFSTYAQGFTLGTTSGNFNGYTVALGSTTTTLTLVETANAALSGNAYWNGAAAAVSAQGGTTTWNSFVNGNTDTSNFGTGVGGTGNANNLVNSSTNVFFDSGVTGTLATTLGQDLTINSLTFSSTHAVSVGGANTLTLQATSTNGNTAGNGIMVATGAANDTITSNVALGKDQTWTVTDSGNTLTVGGGISGGHALTKAGAGTLALTGANTYGGGTTVMAGNLKVNNTTGSATGTGAVVVQNGATLSGGNGAADALGTLTSPGGASRSIYASGMKGIISGPLAINSGAHLAPGNSVGTLTMAALTFDLGSIADYEFNSTANDFTSVSGLLTLNGGGFNLYQEGTTTAFDAPGLYDLLRYGSLAGSLSNLSVLNQQAGYAYTFINDTVGGADLIQLRITAEVAPEPSTWALMLGGLGLLLLVQRARRRSND